MSRQAVRRVVKTVSYRGEKFEIEVGVPVPGARGEVHGMGDILKSLRNGQSVVLPLEVKKASALASYVLGTGKFVTRKADGSGRSTRVWRGNRKALLNGGVGSDTPDEVVS